MKEFGISDVRFRQTAKNFAVKLSIKGVQDSNQWAVPQTFLSKFLCPQLIHYMQTLQACITQYSPVPKTSMILSNVLYSVKVAPKQ